MISIKEKLLKKEVEFYLKDSINEWQPLKSGGSTNASFYGVTASGVSFTAKYSFMCKTTLLQRRIRKDIDTKTASIFPKFIGSFVSFCSPFRVCFITEWILGDDIDLRSFENNMHHLVMCTHLISEQLKLLHSLEVTDRMSRRSLKRDYINALRSIRFYNINIPHLSEFKDYVDKHIDSINETKKGYVHFDFHMGNILKHDCDYRIIDFETVCVSEPWRDLVYAMEINFPEQHQFWFVFLLQYFDGKIPNEFFVHAKLYVIVYMLMLAKYNKSSNNEMYCNLVNKVYEDYNRLKSIVPHWFVETAVELCGDVDRVKNIVEGIELHKRSFVFEKKHID